MQYAAASVVVVSGTVLWISGAILETLLYESHHGGSRSPSEFAQWGGVIVLGLGIALIARMAGIGIGPSANRSPKQD